MITTVGPYLQYGEPLVAACAEAGTDYVDLTGEPRVRRPDVRRPPRDRGGSGARIVHACGFDSIPHDLGAYFTVQQLAADGPIDDARRRPGRRHRSPAAPSTPRWARCPGPGRCARRPRPGAAVEPRPEGRSSRAVAGKPHRDKVLGYWLLPLPTIDPSSSPAAAPRCRRTAPSSATPTTPAPRRCGTPPAARLGAGAVMAAAQVPPLRNFLLGRIKQGDGPDEARRAKSWFTVDFVGEGDGRTVHTRVTGGDPGYGETAKMLAESALCLAFDDNPTTAGQVTTAQAMGDNLMARLLAAGITFETVA